MMSKEKTLIREYVKQILNEDDFGTYADIASGAVDAYGPNGMGGMGGGGIHGDADQLYKIFVKPFVDVVGVTAGKTKELSRKGQTVLRVAFETIATTIVPILSSDYEEIFEKEKQEVERIKGEYAEVYQATWDAFKNHDILFAAFLYRPDLFLTATLAKKAPKAVSNLLSVLSGGALDKILSKLTGGSKSSHNEAIIREDSETEQTKLQKLVSNDKVKSLLANSQTVQSMTKQGKSIVHNTLKTVYDHASASMHAKSLDDIQKAIGKKIPGIEKLSSVPQQERQKAEQQIVMGVKKGIKELYVKQLTAHVKEAIDAGVPEDHPFVQDYKKVIAKIKAL